MTRRPRRWPALVSILLVAACAPPANLVCLPGAAHGLSERIPETSGAAWSGMDPGIFWTVNDGAEGILYAVDTLGRSVARVRTLGSRLEDVEALAAGDCGSGRCLYLADVGDNGEIRDRVWVDRVPEPALEDGSVTRTRFEFRYPDRPRDVEAVFMLPGEELVLVSKGRGAPPQVYRYPPPLRSDTVMVLERLHALGRRAPSRDDMVTGATALPGTDLVLVRTYSSLGAFRYRNGLLDPVDDARITLTPLGEPQGEAVAVDSSGRVLLTTESGPLRSRGWMRLMRCEVGTGAAGDA